MEIILIIILTTILLLLIWMGLKIRSGSRIEEIQLLHKVETEMLRENFENQRRELANQFEVLSRHILAEEQKRLRNENDTGIQALLSPLRSRLDEFQRLVSDAHEADLRGRANLAGQVEQLMKLNLTIGEEARRLTSALKRDTKIQGDWGEHILSTLLEKGGLVKGIHFDTQITRDSSGNVLRNEEGSQLRPDVVVYLPDQRSLIIDSKVSLTAFVDYCNASDDEQRQRHGRRHVESVKKHIKELAEKHYPEVIENACENVMMFMPMENAFLLAFELDDSLWRFAFERKVAVVSPTHLFSAIQIVSQLWVRDDQNKHVAKIAETGGKLYDKLASFCKTFEKIDSAITASRNAYDDAFAQLCSGRGNAIRQAMTLKNLGAKVSKPFPPKFIDANDDLSDEESDS